MKPLEIYRVAILGTGTIGSSWASFFASKGMSVKMHDLDKSFQDSGIQKAKENLKALAKFGLLEKSALDHRMENISPANDFGQLLEGAEYVQESVPENYEVKKEVFKRLNAVAASNTILASSSSGLLMSEIQGATKAPERCLIAHPFNPPHLIPLVELVPGRQTDPQLIESTRYFFRMPRKNSGSS